MQTARENAVMRAADRRLLARRCRGRAGFDDVNADRCKLGGNLEFLFGCQRDAGSLLPVPQGCIKKADLFSE